MPPDPAVFPKPVPDCIFPKRPVEDGETGLLREGETAGSGMPSRSSKTANDGSVLLANLRRRRPTSRRSAAAGCCPEPDACSCGFIPALRGGETRSGMLNDAKIGAANPIGLNAVMINVHRRNDRRQSSSDHDFCEIAPSSSRSRSRSRLRSVSSSICRVRCRRTSSRRPASMAAMMTLKCAVIAA